ncbi:GDYXXLXY domain-containing protein [Parerythrobacter aurantius]|uniref:GDYXXLXY domain-containing protein n=1 Tax=Parerythrobacter aurantius TaxID=3127706 RepID=UPI003245A94C
MKRGATLAALALPLAGLAGLWAWTESWTREGTDWEVPVQGYDPRDLLRGHYIQFEYDWPGETVTDENRWFLGAFCIEGKAPTIERIVVRDDVGGCAHFAKAEPASIYGGEGLRRGRLYVPQTRAGELEQKLANPDLRGIVTVRQRTDGRILPQSIRFRPLTAGERAEREAGREDDTPPPPAIMPSR